MNVDFSPFNDSTLEQEEQAVREMIQHQQFKPGEHGYAFAGVCAFNRIMERLGAFPCLECGTPSKDRLCTKCYVESKL